MNPKHFEHDKNLMAWGPKAGPAVKFVEVIFPTTGSSVIIPVQLEESMWDF